MTLTLHSDTKTIDYIHRIFYDVIHEGFDVITDLSCRVIEHIINDIRHIFYSYWDRLFHIDTDYFSISKEEIGLYMFSIFVTDGIEWSITIEKATGEMEKEYHRRELLSSHVDDLDISKEVASSLREANISKVQDIVNHTYKDLERKLGFQQTNQIRDALMSLGLSLKKIPDIKIKSSISPLIRAC